MDQKPDISKLLHDLRSRSTSLKSAADIFRDCSADEKREMLALMEGAAKDISKCLGELKKTLTGI